MKNISITAKLFIAFGVVVALVLGLSALALIGIGVVYDISYEMVVVAAEAEAGTFDVAQFSEQVAPIEILIQIVVFAVAAVTIIASIIMAIVIRSSILKPVRELEKAARDMSGGKLDCVIQYDGRDELGQLAGHLRGSIATIQAYIQDISRAMAELRKGNFDICATQPFVGDFEEIETSILGMISQLSNTMKQISEVAEQVSSGSEQVSSGSQALAQGATEQASSVEELSVTLNDISSQVKQNAENAENARDKAGQAATSISSSNERMQELMNSMGEIESKSNEIRKIIKTIEDIAFQTNILALNAAVEAARAGAAGKGFAVVADEVRNLAAKSADAAKNTTTLIEGSVSAIAEGVRLAGLTADELNNAVEGVTSTTDMISEITQATEDQATAISQVSVGIEQIASVVQLNSATSEESAAASETLSSQALSLKQLVAHYNLRPGEGAPAGLPSGSARSAVAAPQSAAAPAAPSLGLPPAPAPGEPLF